MVLQLLSERIIRALDCGNRQEVEVGMEASQDCVLCSILVQVGGGWREKMRSIDGQSRRLSIA